MKPAVPCALVRDTKSNAYKQKDAHFLVAWFYKYFRYDPQGLKEFQLNIVN